jgi:glycine hydroxymethyltransferase
VTTRGFGEAEMKEVASCIAQVLRDPQSEDNLAAVRTRVGALTSRFPLYSWKHAAVTA